MNVVYSLLSLLRLRTSVRPSSSLQSPTSSLAAPAPSVLTEVSADPFAGALGLAVLANIASFSPRH